MNTIFTVELQKLVSNFSYCQFPNCVSFSKRKLRGHFSPPEIPVCTLACVCLIIACLLEMTYIKYTVSQHPLCHKIPEAGPYDSCLASLRLFSLIFTALSTETWAWSCCAERVSKESVSCDISPRPLGVLLAFADGYSSWSASSCIRMCHFSPKGFVETSRSTLYLLYICRLMSTFVIFSAYQDVPPIRKSFKPNTSIYCSLNVSYALSCISYLLLHNKILPEFNSLKQQPLCLL